MGLWDADWLVCSAEAQPVSLRLYGSKITTKCGKASFGWVGNVGFFALCRVQSRPVYAVLT